MLLEISPRPQLPERLLDDGALTVIDRHRAGIFQFEMADPLDRSTWLTPTTLRHSRTGGSRPMLAH